MLLGLCAALAAAALFGSAAILQAIASRHVPVTSGFSPDLVKALLREPMFLAALALILSGFAFHLTALRQIPLFLAQSGIAASLVVTAILAVRVFHDPLSPRDWVSVGAVCIGLALMASSSGSVGDERASGRFIVGLFAALAIVGVAGVAASRTARPGGTAILGSLAGLGFAGVSIAARVLPDLHVSTVLSSPATYAMCLSGAVAFLLYSLALQRGTVTGATAPMIATQTVTPAAVGVLLLNDGIRQGMLPIAALGFAITCAGAIALARFEAAPDHHA